VLKSMRQRSKPSAVAVLVALENLCFEQRAKRGGNVCVGSLPYLASMSGVHEDTVRNMVAVFEEFGIVRVKRCYNPKLKTYSENHYTLLLVGGGVGEGFDHLVEYGRGSESSALSKEKGEASKCPAATAASPLALRHFDASRSGDNGLAAEAVGDFDTGGYQKYPPATPPADNSDNVTIKTPTAAEQPEPMSEAEYQARAQAALEKAQLWEAYGE